MGLSTAIAIHGLYDFLVFKRYFWGLVFIVLLLYLVKAFLDHRVGDALVASPFRPPDVTEAQIRGEEPEEEDDGRSSRGGHDEPVAPAAGPCTMELVLRADDPFPGIGVVDHHVSLIVHCRPRRENAPSRCDDRDDSAP